MNYSIKEILEEGEIISEYNNGILEKVKLYNVDGEYYAIENMSNAYRI